jgi:hypothetical protein
MNIFDTITKEAVDRQNERLWNARRVAEQEGQGIEVIAVAPGVNWGGTFVLAWWPRSSGEYVCWSVGENGFYNGRYWRCDEPEAWTRFYKRLLDD